MNAQEIIQAHIEDKDNSERLRKEATHCDGEIDAIDAQIKDLTEALGTLTKPVATKKAPAKK